MSTTTAPADELQKHATVLSQTVYGPEFFNKLASHGVQPNNNAEAGQLLELAILLEETNWQPTKVAAVANPFLSAIIGDLQQQQAVKMSPQIIKQASANAVSQNADLRAAALAIGQARTQAAA